jgi:antitoxin (DNA-binding transcriptional repressor) of toxin-antitoxin stability system
MVSDRPEVPAMAQRQTISATEFKAKCLDILDQLADRRLDEVRVTKRGQVVAILTPPADPAAAIRGLHGFLRDAVTIPEAADLTAPVLDQAPEAERGRLHG